MFLSIKEIPNLKMLFFVFLFLGTLCACEHDDDDNGGYGDDDDEGGMVMEITAENQCEAAFIFAENIRVNEVILSQEDIPVDIRSYIASNHAGVGVSTSSYFQIENNSKYTEVKLVNGLLLLFDSSDVFVCANFN